MRGADFVVLALAQGLVPALATVGSNGGAGAEGATATALARHPKPVADALA
jgi:hypothetical protein